MGILRNLNRIFNRHSTDELGDIAKSIDDQINQANSSIDNMKLELNMQTATGEWLDEWGSRFGVKRRSGETDDLFRPRVLESRSPDTGTIPSLIKAVKRSLGDDTTVTAYETFEDLRIFNISTFNGEGKYQDSDTVRTGVVKLTIDKPSTDLLRSEIYKTKPTGCRVIIEELI